MHSQIRKIKPASGNAKYKKNYNLLYHSIPIVATSISFLSIFYSLFYLSLSLSLSLSQMKDGVGCSKVENNLRWQCFGQRWWQWWVQSWGEAPLQFNNLLFSPVLNRMDDMWHMVNPMVINKRKSRTNFLTFFLCLILSLIISSLQQLPVRQSQLPNYKN